MNPEKRRQAKKTRQKVRRAKREAKVTTTMRRHPNSQNGHHAEGGGRDVRMVGLPAPKQPDMNSYEVAVKWPDPILSVECPEVPSEMFDSDVFKETAAKLKMLVEHDGNSLGMAAPQIGSKLRMMALKTFNGTHVLVNPVLAKSEGTQVGPEGCFSVPDVRVDKIERAEQVWVNALDVHGAPVSAHFTALIAVAFQHELDHLNGRTILMHGEPEPWVA